MQELLLLAARLVEVPPLSISISGSTSRKAPSRVQGEQLRFGDAGCKCAEETDTIELAIRSGRHRDSEGLVECPEF